MSSRGPSSTARGGQDRHAAARRRRRCAPRVRSARTSSTRTSSCPPGSSPRSPAGRRSSSPRTGRTSRTPVVSRAVRSATRLTVRRAARGRRRLDAGCSSASSRSRPTRASKSSVIDCGVDLERVRAARRDGSPSARSAGRRTAPAFVCVGSLSERKNVLRLARAFERRGEGELAFVGDGPLRRRSRAVRASASPAASTTTRVAALDRCGRRGLPAEPGRALRPLDAGGAWPRAAPSSRRASAARPSSSRPAPASSSTPSTTTPCAQGSTPLLLLPRPEPCGPCGSRGARRQAAGGAGGGASGSCCRLLEVGKPELDERADRLLEPASRAASSAAS